jgi:ABC-2 type transport system permease protein
VRPVAEHVTRRGLRASVPFGYAAGAIVFASAAGYASAYPTHAARQRFAAALGSNIGVRALIGPARRLDTVAGFTAWRCVGLLTLAGAVWACLVSTRLLRGEEEAGRTELLLAGPTSRRSATTEAVAGLAAAWAVMWCVTALLVLIAGRFAHPGFSVGGCLLLSLTVLLGAAEFLVVGAVMSQLVSTRRQAAMGAGLVLGLSFALRMVGDSDDRVRWLVWASPLGWIEHVHPLTGGNAVAIVPVLALIVLLVTLAIWLGRRRDLGAASFEPRARTRHSTGLLSGTEAFSTRLVLPTAVAWTAGVSAGGLLLGLVAQSAAGGSSGSAEVTRAIARLGGNGAGAASYLGIAFLLLTMSIAFLAIGQVSAAREEESTGRLENLLAQPVRQGRWLGGRLLVGAAVIVVAGVFAAIAAWVGVLTQHTDISLRRLLAAGVNTSVLGLLLLGVGALLLARAPRAAVPCLYAAMAWSIVVEFIGSVLAMPRWLLQTSLLFHVAPAPATSPDWAALAVMLATGLLAGGLAVATVRRRDYLTG